MLVKHAQGALQLHDLVPATFGVWHTAIETHPLSVDHTHLLNGDSIDFSAAFAPETHRLDALLLCPALAGEVHRLAQAGVVISICLN